MFAAYAVTDQLFPAHNLPAQSANRKQANDHLRTLLNAIIDRRRDTPTPIFKPTDTDTSH